MNSKNLTFNDVEKKPCILNWKPLISVSSVDRYITRKYVVSLWQVTSSSKIIKVDLLLLAHAPENEKRSMRSERWPQMNGS